MPSKPDRVQRRLVLLGAAVLATASIAWRADAPEQTIHYHGIRPTDPHGRDGLANPERGLRTETRIARGRDEPWIKAAKRYARHGLTLVQTYCYLTEFANTRLSDEKLAHLERSFDALRANGLKAVLRFAYEFDRNSPGPRLADVRRHIAQLKPLLERHVDVVAVVEAGFIGLWGEWHHSVHGLDKDVEAQRQIVMDLLGALPGARHVQFRRPRYKRAILGEHTPWVTAKDAHRDVPAARMGFHSDYFVVQKHGWDITPGTKDFEQAAAEGPFLWMGGEMPWGSDARRRKLRIDGLGAATRMRDHHYTVFSLAHNFEEGGREHDMKRWMKTPLSAAQARDAKLPVSDGYFENERGEPVERTEFEYIRDHLGYRLELQHATFAAQARRGQDLPCRIALVNRGFATLHNPRPVYVVLIDAHDRVALCQKADADPRRWQPHRPGDPERIPLMHEVAVRLRLPGDLPTGRYRLGLWLPDAHPSIRHDARYAIRVANRDAPEWLSPDGRYRANILAAVSITD